MPETTTGLRTEPAFSTQAIEQGARHTPGPWKIEKSRGGQKARINGEGWQRLARVWVMVADRPSAEGEANARLIAAAPDLLTACQDALENRNDWMAAMTAAIAKATGAAS